MEKKYTIKDIATLAGVSKSTVSRYFNEGYIKEETRSRIAAVVEQCNYTPNLVARNLKSKKSMIIGIIIPTISSNVMSRLVESLEKDLQKNNYHTVIINTKHDVDAEIEALSRFHHMQVDGIVLFATVFTAKHYEIMNTLSIPVVSVGQANQEGISIVNGDYDAGFELGTIIGQKGYQKPLYIGVNQKDIAVGLWRKQGVFDGLKKQGIKDILYRESDFTFDTTRKLMREIIGNENFDVVICSSDNMALAAYKELLLQGIGIPKQVAVTGFGGYESSALLHPSLQTVRFDNEQTGILASKHIQALIEGEEVKKITFTGYKIINGDSL